ncbi:MAG: RHS repeat-associated core domain-containing protein [Bacteroidota bacterium]
MKHSLPLLFLLMALTISSLGWSQQLTPPDGIAPDRNGVVLHPLFGEEAPPTAMDGLGNNDEVYLFPCCTEIRKFFTEIRLEYQDPTFSIPTTDWSYTVEFELYLNGTPQWHSSLSLDLTTQTVLAVVFHDDATVIDPSNSYLKIIDITNEGAPTTALFISAKLYEARLHAIDPDRTLGLAHRYDKHLITLSWTDEIPNNEIVDGYELEWVFYESEFNRPAGFRPFEEKTPVSVLTRAPHYVIDQLFPSGSLYYRVRRWGVHPHAPGHTVYGKWVTGTEVTGFATNDEANWQQTITYAEEGKNKKVLSFFDGTLRPTQTLTNLSTGNKTVVADVAYDFEGRKVIDFLPFTLEGWSPEAGHWNAFGNRHHGDQAAYDNGSAPNAPPSAYGSDDYYTWHEDPYVPRSNGYAYTQSQYRNDAAGTPVKQSGVGETFAIDGDRTTNYHYGSATRSELVRLFGERNIGNENHYRKHLVQDPNEQVSVTYLDPQGRTIATALAGAPPSELDALDELPDDRSVDVDLSDVYVTSEAGVRTTYYTILNVARRTSYDFSYSLNAISQSVPFEGGTICTSCRYDVSIGLVDPQGNSLMDYIVTDVTAPGCRSENVVASLPSVVLNEVGEYTLIKQVVPHRLTYQEARREVLNQGQVIQTISQIANEVSLDVSLCTIDTDDYTVEELFRQIIPQRARQVAHATCAGIRSEIIQEVLDENPGLTWAMVDADFDNLAGDRDRYCEYTFCTRNTDSEVFDAQMFAVSNWADAKRYVSSNPDLLLLFDPFFRSPNDGFLYQTDMQAALNDYKIHVGGKEYRGSISELVDPDNDDMKWEDPETGASHHVLYFEAQSTGASGTTIDEMRWMYFRSFYLNIKNKMKIEYAKDQACATLQEALEKRNGDDYLNGSGSIADQIRSYDQNGLVFQNYEVSDFQLNRLIDQLEEGCVSGELNATARAAIAGHFETYFNANRLNLLLRIPLSHLNLPPLKAIDEILAANGCLGLDNSSLIDVLPTSSNCGGCNAYLFGLDFYVNRYRFNCEQNRNAIRQIEIDRLTDEYIDEQVTHYLSSYNCSDLIDESFRYTYVPKEYHYTLYYYDRAGNLVQTVPPRGVVADGTGHHTLATNYQYNSLHQLVRQESPDGGTTRFWYNGKGQLRMSQNQKQAEATPQQFSYTKYDAQGRIVEVGEADGGPAAVDANDPDYPAAANYELTEITRTYYDVGLNPEGLVQENVRGRVAYVTLLADEATPSVSTYYSYDAHGNVKSLLQDITGFDPKRVDYAFDLVSGNVNFVAYQQGKEDQFYHRYEYDADNRITRVATSVDGVIWNREAAYFYHDHGPLKRMELGEGQNLQGVDYYYTLQGWLKGVNAPIQGDPGQDEHMNFGRDLVSFNLGYYAGDFVGGTGAVDFDTRDRLWDRADETLGHQGLYNGNISWMNTWLPGLHGQEADVTKGMQAMLYGYDQLNRIKAAYGLTDYTQGTGYAPRGTKEAYDTRYSFDPNGNLRTLERKDADGLVSHRLNYAYAVTDNRLQSVTGADHEVLHVNAGELPDEDIYPKVVVDGAVSVKNGENVDLEATQSIRLKPGFSVRDGGVMRGRITTAMATTDFEVGDYVYDGIGNLVRDETQELSIDWTVYGKVDQVHKDDGDEANYTYDAAGNRVVKSFTRSGATKTTYYIRDASGNILAVYDDDSLKEIPMYGSSRLGTYVGGGSPATLRLGLRRYELSNHLGNVMTTFSDELTVNEAGKRNIKVTSASDYYPFGLAMPGRSKTAASYLYGFNGKPKDDAGEFGSTVYDYGFRIYNPSIAKFLSVDPLTKSYPQLTPYQFASNRPIDGVDLDGLEYLDADEARIEAKYGNLRLKLSNFNWVFRSNWNNANADPKNWAPGEIGLNRNISSLVFVKNSSITDVSQNGELSINYPTSLGPFKKAGFNAKNGDPNFDFTEIKLEVPKNKSGVPDQRFKQRSFSAVGTGRTTGGARAIGFAHLISATIEFSALFGASRDQSKLREQIAGPLVESINLLESALNDENSLIPNKFRNPNDLSGILNVILQGENSNDEQFKVGFDILRKSGVEINDNTRERYESIINKENCRTCGVER